MAIVECRSCDSIEHVFDRRRDNREGVGGLGKLTFEDLGWKFHKSRVALCAQRREGSARCGSAGTDWGWRLGRNWLR